MSVEDNKAMMRDYLDRFWNQGDEGAGEQSVAEDVVLHDLADVPIDLPAGRAGLFEMRKVFETAMPDFKMTIDDMIGEGDRLLIRWTGEGTHTGDFMGIPPTHRTAKWTAMSVARIQDGKMVEGWQNMDEMGLMQQLGVLPGGTPPLPMRLFIAARGRLQARRNKRSAG